MNLLENYIIEIYKEVPLDRPKWDNKNREWVHAYYKCNCHGRVQDMDMIYTVDEWNAIKERGYFFG